MNSNYSFFPICTGTKIKFSTTVQCTSVSDERLSFDLRELYPGSMNSNSTKFNTVVQLCFVVLCSTAVPVVTSDR